jgi:hypothetical protein
VLEDTNAKKVTVEEHIDGKMYILYGSKKLKYIEVKTRPKIQKEIKVKKQRQAYVPKSSHPWKRSYGKDWLSPVKV